MHHNPCLPESQAENERWVKTRAHRGGALLGERDHLDEHGCEY